MSGDGRKDREEATSTSAALILGMCIIAQRLGKPVPAVYYTRRNIAEIDLDTICQYTGLKTASGVRICENDIIAIATGENGEEYRGLVEYEHSGFVIKWVNSDYLRTDLWYWANRPGADVIGNAFDTPNLLSKESDSVVFHDFMKRGME